MAISDTITSMYENVGEVYDTITNVTLPEHKNIENIPRTIRDSYLQIMNNGIDVIYDNWEKVTGSGESLSLTPTEKAPMGIIYKGNTYQYSTTGKNLFNVTNKTQTTHSSGLTYKVENNIFTITGTNTSSSAYSLISWTNGQVQTHLDSIFQKGKTFTLSANNSLSGLYFQINYFKEGSSSQSQLTNLSGLGGKATFTIPQDFDHTGNVFLGVYANATTINGSFSFQLEEGSAKTDFEPYTNGASPNPDYPQEIQVVSGDNTIEVCGKNFVKSSSKTGNLYFLNGATGYDSYVFKPGTYTLSYKNNSGTNIGCFFQSPNESRNLGSATSITFISSEKFNVWFYRSGMQDGDVSEVQLEVGSTKTDYEPYNGDTYELDLGVENLFDLPSEETATGITYSINDDKTINLSGTASANTTFILYKDLADSKIINGDTYTFFANKTLPSGVEIRLEAYNGTTWLRHILNSVLNSTIQKITGSANTTSATRVRYHIYIASGTSVNISNLGLQLEAGTKANSYSEYGTTPIELCKIGDYQDRIFKNTPNSTYYDSNLEDNVWYLNKQIGKIVLDGVTTGKKFVGNWTTNIYGIGYYVTSTGFDRYYLICDIFKYTNAATKNMPVYTCGGTSGVSGTITFILPSTIEDVESANTFLSTHNALLYGVLNEPTFTKITDSTLLEQLEAIKTSYENQTNISQENNDLPFILDVSSLEKV